MRTLHKIDQEQAASIILSILAPVATTVRAAFGAGRGLARGVFVSKLEPYLFCESVPLAPMLATRTQCASLLSSMFDRMDSDSAGTVSWERFYGYLLESHAQRLRKVGPPSDSALRFHVAADLEHAVASCGLYGITQSVAASDIPRWFSLSREGVIKGLDTRLWELKLCSSHNLEDASSEVSPAAAAASPNAQMHVGTSTPTAIEYVPFLKLLVVAANDSQGPILSCFDAMTGALVAQAPSPSVTVRLRWHTRMSLLLGGTALGEITCWRVERKIVPGGTAATGGSDVFVKQGDRLTVGFALGSRSVRGAVNNLQASILGASHRANGGGGGGGDAIHVLTHLATSSLHKGPISCIEPLALDTVVATAGAVDGFIILYDVHRHVMLRAVRAHDKGVVHLAYDDSLHMLISAGCGPVPRVWLASLPDGAESTPLQDACTPHEHMLVAVGVVPDANLYFSLDVKGVMKLWDSRTLACAQSLVSSAKQSEQRVAGWLHAVVLPSNKPSTTVIATTTETKVFFHRSAANEAVVAITAVADVNPIFSIIPNLADGTLVTVSNKGKFSYWGLETGEHQISFQRLIDREVTAVALDTTGRRMFIGSSHGDVSCHTYGNGMMTQRFPNVHNGKVTFLNYCVTAIGTQVVVSCGEDGTIAATAVSGTTGTTAAGSFALASCVFATSTPVLAVAVDPVVSYFVVITASGELKMWDCSTFIGKDEGFPLVDAYSLMPSLRMQVSPPAFALIVSAGLIVVPDGSDNVSLISRQGQKTVRLGWWATANNGAVVQLHFLAAQSFLVTREDNGHVVVYSLEPHVRAMAIRRATGCAVDVSMTPATIASFTPFPPTTHITAMCCVPELGGVLFAANSTLEGCAFSVAGTHLGRLDMANTDAVRWKVPTLAEMAGATSSATAASTQGGTRSRSVAASESLRKRLSAARLHVRLTIAGEAAFRRAGSTLSKTSLTSDGGTLERSSSRRASPRTTPFAGGKRPNLTSDDDGGEEGDDESDAAAASRSGLGAPAVRLPSVVLRAAVSSGSGEPNRSAEKPSSSEDLVVLHSVPSFTSMGGGVSTIDAMLGESGGPGVSMGIPSNGGSTNALLALSRRGPPQAKMKLRLHTDHPLITSVAVARAPSDEAHRNGKASSQHRGASMSQGFLQGSAELATNAAATVGGGGCGEAAPERSRPALPALSPSVAARRKVTELERHEAEEAELRLRLFKAAEGPNSKDPYAEQLRQQLLLAHEVSVRTTGTQDPLRAKLSTDYPAAQLRGDGLLPCLRLATATLNPPQDLVSHQFHLAQQRFASSHPSHDTLLLAAAPRSSSPKLTGGAALRAAAASLPELPDLSTVGPKAGTAVSSSVAKGGEASFDCGGTHQRQLPIGTAATPTPKSTCDAAGEPRGVASQTPPPRHSGQAVGAIATHGGGQRLAEIGRGASGALSVASVPAWLRARLLQPPHAAGFGRAGS